MTTIAQLKSALSGGGARPNLFEIQITLPNKDINNGIFSTKKQQHLDGVISFMCKATALPAENVGVVEVPFRGRSFKVAGDRTVDNWNCTFINDDTFNIHQVMHRWTDALHGNLDQLGMVNPSTYMGSAILRQLSRNTKGDDARALTTNEKNANKTTLSTIAEEGLQTEDSSGDPLQLSVAGKSRTLFEWNLIDIWPVNVGEISLGMDSTDSIEEFTVEFAVQSFKSHIVPDRETHTVEVSG